MDCIQEKPESVTLHQSPLPPTPENMAGHNRHSESLPKWMAAAAVVIVAVDLRPGIVSIGPALASIRQEFGLSHTGASLLTAIPDLLMGALALPTPWLSRRFGRDQVLLTALMILCLATAGRAFANTQAQLLLATAGVGVGIAVAGTLIAGFRKANFAGHAAIMMGVYATALSAGSTISAAMTGWMATLTPSGWRFATGVWSLLGVSAVAIWLVVTIRERGLKSAQQPNVTKAHLPLRNKTAWLIAAFFALNNFLFYALIAWIAPMSRESGASSTVAGLLLASFTAAFTLGNPVFGFVSKSHGRRIWLAVCTLLAASGLIGITILPQITLFFWLPLAAFGLAGGFTLGMTLPLDNTHSVEESNVWTAFTLTFGYLVAAAGPILVGAIRDATGSFEIPYRLLAAVATLMLGLTPLLGPHKPELSSELQIGDVARQERGLR
jgi:MFS transporter, CP family, cyanate transporter